MTAAIAAPIKTALKTVEINNFLCFKHQVFDFSAPNGLYLFTGKNLHQPASGTNGVGKTTTFSAICWALFGKNMEGERAGSLKKQGTKGGYSVVLNFEKNGKPVVIRRSWSPNSLTINGEEVEQSAIESFLGLTFEQFSFGIYWGQGKKHFIDLSASEKLSFLSELFQLDQWLKCSDIAKTKFKEASTKLEQAEFKRQEAETSLASLQQRLESAQIASADWHDLQLTSIAQIETERDLVAKEIEAMSPYVVTADPMSDKTVVTQQKELQAKINEVVRAVSSLETEMRIKHKALEKLVAAENSICPECLQEVPSEHIEPLAQKMLSEYDALEAQLLEKKALKKSLDAEAQALEKELQKVRDAQSQCQQINLKAAADERVKAEKQKRLDGLIRAIEEEKRSVNPYQNQIEDFTTRIAASEQQLIELAQAITTLNKEVAHLELWVKRFPQLRLTILNEVVDELEMHFNQAFGTLGYLNWQVTIQTERELKSEAIKPELTIKLKIDDQEVYLGTMSGGEKQRIRIACALGVSELIKARLGVHWGILFLDEPMHNLSEEGVNTLLAMLEDISNNVAIYLAEHMVLDKAKFTAVYELVKTSDGTPHGNSVLVT